MISLTMPHPLEDLLKECGNSSQCTYTKFSSIKDVLDKIVRYQPPFDMSVLNVKGAYYNDHGIDHFERIENNYFNLIQNAEINLSCCEVYLALLSIWLHDIGLFLGRKVGESPDDARKYHHERVKSVLDYLLGENLISRMEASEEALVTRICAGHSRKTDLNSIAETAPLNGEEVRPRLLSTILRISDALDIDHRRAPESVFEIFEETIPSESKKHWQKHRPISGIRFNRTHATIDVVTVFENSLPNFVEQFLLVQWVISEIKNELYSVKEIFEHYDIPFHNVNMKDLVTGELLNTESIPASGYLRIEIQEANIDNDKLTKLSELFKSKHGDIKVFLEIDLSAGGRITIPLPDEYDIDYNDSMQDSIRAICTPILLDIKEDAKSIRVIRQ